MVVPAAVSVNVYAVPAWATTGPAVWVCTPVAVPLVVAVFPWVIPPPVIARPNWSVLSCRLTTFFASCRVGGLEQAARSTPTPPPAGLKLTCDGPAVVAPVCGLSFTIAVPPPLVEYSTKRSPVALKAMPL